LATDCAADLNVMMAELSADTIEKLNQVLPPTWPHGNPVDIIGDAPGSRYRAALEILIRDPVVDAVLVLNCPTAIASGTEAAQSVIDALGTEHEPMVLTSWVGDAAATEARRLFRQHGIPTYWTPEHATRAFMYLVNYRRRQELLMETPPSVPEDFTPDLARARRLVGQALAEGRPWLTEPEAKDLLAAYRIPVVKTLIAANPKEAAEMAAAIGAPVALKILSRDITHKSDLGGVALGLLGASAVRDAAIAMEERLRAARPNARLGGFSVQPMVHRPGSYELILGVSDDAEFGPVILFGHGGTAVEVINDKALALPPLNMKLAHELISSTRIYRLLEGFRGQAGANLEAIALTLIKLAQLVIDLPEVAELDINPLLADAEGVIALDARVNIKPTPAESRLAICPYPKGLEDELILKNGQTLFLRPIRPEDEPMLQAAFAQFTPEQIRLRFLIPVKTLTHVTAARFTQIDYDRDMSLIATERGVAGTTEIYGVVSLNADPDMERAEYGIIVCANMTRRGLGRQLMQRMIDYARSRGIREIVGDVLAENFVMLKLCASLGFRETHVREERGVIRVVLQL
jgi:acetyltransferase